MPKVRQSPSRVSWMPGLESSSGAIRGKRRRNVPFEMRPRIAQKRPLGPTLTKVNIALRARMPTSEDVGRDLGTHRAEGRGPISRRRRPIRPVGDFRLRRRFRRDCRARRRCRAFRAGPVGRCRRPHRLDRCGRARAERRSRPAFLPDRCCRRCRAPGLPGPPLPPPRLPRPRPAWRSSSAVVASSVTVKASR
jgi:hypothetical protein